MSEVTVCLFIVFVAALCFLRAKNSEMKMLIFSECSFMSGFLGERFLFLLWRLKQELSFRVWLGQSYACEELNFRVLSCDWCVNVDRGADCLAH